MTCIGEGDDDEDEDVPSKIEYNKKCWRKNTPFTSAITLLPRDD